MIMGIREIANTANSPIRVQSSTADPLMTAEAITFHCVGLSLEIFARLLDGTLDGIFEGPPACLRLGNNRYTGNSRYGDGNSQGNAHRHRGGCES